LRTVWLDTEGSSALALPRLLVPRSAGFWWLGLTSNCLEEAHEGRDDTGAKVEVEISETLWSAPIGVRSIPDTHDDGWNCRSPDVFCSTRFGTDIYWVWPEFISVNKFGESGCGVHPDYTSRPEVHRLNDLDTPLPVGEVFGRSAEASLRSAYDRAAREYRSRHREDGCDAPRAYSPTAWHVERQAAGRWVLEGWADTHRLCEVGIDYSANVDFSRITGTKASQAPPMRSVSGVKDVVASADGRWVLIIRTNEVVLSRREAPDTPIARSPLSNTDSVVMAEWANGRNVARWRNQVHQLAEPQ